MICAALEGIVNKRTVLVVPGRWTNPGTIASFVVQYLALQEQFDYMRFSEYKNRFLFTNHFDDWRTRE